jgi:hypothetical protein
MHDVDKPEHTAGRRRERETSGLDSHPPSPADPTSIATLHDEVIAHMAIALRLITLAFAPAPEVGIKPACAALRREWWARLRPVFSVSDPLGQAAREPAGADRVRFRDHAAEARSAWRPSPRKSRRTRTDTETMSGALCGTDGSNPVPSSGESNANLTSRRDLRRVRAGLVRSQVGWRPGRNRGRSSETIRAGA